MPLAGTYTWKQTPLYVHLSVPLKGTGARDVDVYVSPLYVKINFSPYLTEIDLLHAVRDDSAAQTAVVRDGELRIRLTKVQPASWPTLEVGGLGRRALRERRARDVEEKRARDAAAKEDAQAKRSENERRAVRVQMKVDEGEHSMLDTLKDEEKRQAEEETYRVLENLQRDKANTATRLQQRQQHGNGGSGDGSVGGRNEAPALSAAHAPVARERCAGSGGGAAAVQDDDDIDDSDVMQELERQAERARREEVRTAAGDIWPEDSKGGNDGGGGGGDDDEDDDAPRLPAAAADAGAGESEAAKDDRGDNGGGNDDNDDDDDLAFVPQPRQTGGVVKVGFTKRFFKTPLRESKRAEEEDWIAKNQRGLSDHPDARDIAERDPFWLKGKGDDFFKAKDYHGAVNAYTAALQSQPKMFAALSNRAAAFLALRRFDEAAADATAALAVVERETASRAKCLKLWVRRGTALCGKGQYDAALEDYRRAQAELEGDTTGGGGSSGSSGSSSGGGSSKPGDAGCGGGGSGASSNMAATNLRKDIRTIERLKRCAGLKREADHLFREQRHADAVARYGDALAVDAGFVSCYTNRAAAHLAGHDFRACAADASAALALLGIERPGDDRNTNGGGGGGDDDDEAAAAATENATSGKRKGTGTGAGAGTKSNTNTTIPTNHTPATTAAAACTGPVPAEGTNAYAAWLVNVYVKRGVARAHLGQLGPAVLDYEAAAAAQPANAQVRKDLARLRKRVARQRAAGAGAGEAEPGAAVTGPGVPKRPEQQGPLPH